MDESAKMNTNMHTWSFIKVEQVKSNSRSKVIFKRNPATANLQYKPTPKLNKYYWNGGTLSGNKIPLTLIKLRGGTKCPKHFRTLTILSMMKYGLSILHVNFFFGVKNHSKIKFWGYWKRNFEKFAFEIFFSLKIKAKNFEIIFFQKVFIPNHTFWWQI